MKKAILYTRVEKEGVPNPNEKLKKQEDELREYCESNNYEVIRVVGDIAPGKDFNRHEFTKAYLDIRMGKLQADYFLFTSIDVFATNLEEIYRMHHHLGKFGIVVKGIRPVTVCYIRIIKND